MDKSKTLMIRLSALVFLALFTMTAYAQNFSVDAPNVVEKDEIFRIVYTADAEVEEFTAPELSGLELLAGPMPSRISSTNIVNGVRTDVFEINYTIMVRAGQTGVATVSPASVKIDGKQYTSKALRIEVVAGNNSSSGSSGNGNDTQAGSTPENGEVSSEDIFLKLSFSKTRVVRGEPIVATLKLYTRVPIAGFEDVKFPVFNGFWSQELETPQNINFVRENYNNQVYNSAVLRRYILLPQQTGDLTVDPSYMVCQIQIRTSGGGFSMFDSFFDTYQTIRKRLSTPSATIKVNPLPSGAPASFGGGVGDFTMEVKLSADSIKAHEAGSLTVEISGSGNINLIETPIVELPQDFEKYDVKTDNSFSNGTSGLSGKKVFEFPFIPRSEGLFVIPPVKYSYYSIRQGRYITLESDTLKLKVLENSNASSSGQVVSGVNKQSVVNLGSDIRYIFTSSADLAKKGHFLVASWYFAAAVIFIVLLFLVADKVLKEREKLRGDIRRTRNRRANKVARNRLKLAQSYLAKGLQAPFYEELHKALLGYVSDKLSIQFAEMQRDAIIELLDGRGIQAQDRDELISLIEECEMARYSQQQSDGAMDGQYKRAIDIISTLENKL